MTANEDLEKIRRAVTGRAGPASPYAETPHAGGPAAPQTPGTPDPYEPGPPAAPGGKTAAGKGKKKGGPSPLPPDATPARRPEPEPEPSERRSGGGVLFTILLLVATVFAVNYVTESDLSRLDLPSWLSGPSAGTGTGQGTSGGSGSYAERGTPKLKISPRSGSVRTTITVTGSGFIRDGQVRLIFHAHLMGTARTDGKGRFKARMRIPDADFYGHFPGQTFSISTTEWTRDGTYQRNGPRVGFHLT
ncbi:hypothetical protein HTZ77_06500 [Nonomuraea sp. SMC257]|uniref:Uncharacterized protein n=1 Tax=Nonomuraea montanisoli TaxID=2741721 RepID=A0A7Y6M273_9ACTN|nr:hypothetical protein [Nonomuraea montanisoli]NUW31070.1 hypothetical protein [Nonomuraea montanisoli]